MRRRSFLATAAATGMAPGLVRPARADAWPSRPIKLVAPFAPGGGSDFTSRLIAEKLSARLGQTMLVDNKPGEGGNLGAEFAIKAPADGYTFLTISGSYAINSILHSPSFDSLNDIVAIGQFTDEPTVLVVNPSVPARNLADLFALCRRDPGKLTFGSSGPGGLVHLGTEFALEAGGVKATHVPYRGTAPALNDLVAGQIDIILDQTSNSISQVRAGTIRAYAVTDAKRVEQAADIPTTDQAGLPGFHMTLWSGLWAPKGTPKEVIAKLNRAALDALNDPSVRTKLENLGLQMTPADQLSPQALGTLQKAEIEKWWPMIRAANVKAE